MKDIKYRQPIRDKEGNFIEWFYWGFIDGQWVSWVNQLNGLDTRTESQQFTGIFNKDAKEIYEGDTVKTSYGKIGNILYHKERACFIIYDSEHFNEQLCHEIPFIEIIGNIVETKKPNCQC